MNNFSQDRCTAHSDRLQSRQNQQEYIKWHAWAAPSQSGSHLSRVWGETFPLAAQVRGTAATPLERETGSDGQVFCQKCFLFNGKVYVVHVVIWWYTRHVHFLGSRLLCPITWISMVEPGGLAHFQVQVGWLTNTEIQNVANWLHFLLLMNRGII